MAEPAVLTKVQFINNFRMQKFIKKFAQLCSHLARTQGANETMLTEEEILYLKQATSSLKLTLTNAFKAGPISLIQTNYLRTPCPDYLPINEEYPNDEVYEIYRYSILAFEEMKRCDSSLRGSTIHENDLNKGLKHLDVIDLMLDEAAAREFITLPQASPHDFVPDPANTGSFSDAQRAAAAASSSG